MQRQFSVNPSSIFELSQAPLPLPPASPPPAPSPLPLLSLAPGAPPVALLAVAPLSVAVDTVSPDGSTPAAPRPAPSPCPATAAVETGSTLLPSLKSVAAGFLTTAS